MMKQEYIFGNLANRPEVPPLTWSPDSKQSINPHMLICGGSGSGKTTFLKKIVRYLTDIGKHIFIFDLKEGGLVFEDDNGEQIGNYIEFTVWNSQHGINPFEFDTGISKEELELIINGEKELTTDQKFKVQNSGPKVQVDRFIEIIQKSFLPNMGTMQKDVLTYLLTDTYLSKGFKYNDINTWLRELPSLSDTKELIERAKGFFNDGNGTILNEKSAEYIVQLQNDAIGIQSLEDRLEKDEDEKQKIEKALKEAKESVHKKLDEYIEYAVKNLNEKNLSTNNEWFATRGINADKYANKEVIRTIEKLGSYIGSLVDSGVFHSARPPVKPGLNVINISGLDVKIQRFIVDVWLGKVFKACKIRGAYEDRIDKSRGEKCDTFVIVDESKLIAGSTKDKNDPYSYLNRIATESRSFGLGLIVASQSANHFPEELTKNFHSQIILNTSIADFDSVKKSFGIDKEELKHTQKAFGNALVKTGRSFTKVKLTKKY